MSLIDTDGTGTLAGAGTRDAINRGYGSYATYDIGRFLVAGGGSVTEDGLTGVPTRTARVIDTRTGTPVGDRHRLAGHAPRQHNLTVLADGSVLATGGQKTNGGGGLVDLANAVYTAERWDPATGAWTELAAAAVARQYHSVALLLPGRARAHGRRRHLRRLPVRSATCAATSRSSRRRTCTARTAAASSRTRPVDHRRAGRRSATTARSRCTAPTARSRKLALVRLGAPTHSQDQSQRYVPLPLHARPARRHRRRARTTRTRRPPATTCCSRSTPTACRRMASIVVRPAPGRQRRRAGTGQPRAQHAPPPGTHRRASAPRAPAKAVNGSVSGGCTRQVLHQGHRHAPAHGRPRLQPADHDASCQARAAPGERRRR